MRNFLTYLLVALTLSSMVLVLCGCEKKNEKSEVSQNETETVSPVLDNDEYQIIDDEVTTKTNNSGGIIGGMSNGMPIVSRIAVKPTPSISKCQDSVNLEKMENEKIEIKGRHDPCICPRVTVVAESSTAIVLADHMIRSGFIHPTNLDK